MEQEKKTNYKLPRLVSSVLKAITYSICIIGSYCGVSWGLGKEISIEGCIISLILGSLLIQFYDREDLK